MMTSESYPQDPRRAETEELIAACTAQTRAYFQRRDSDTRFCYELFRRAVLEHVQPAWDALYAEYSPIVASWVREHAGFATLGEDAAAFVNCAFAALWRNLAHPDKFAQFPTLEGILAYLKACARSCVRDEARKLIQRARLHTLALPDDDAAERDLSLADPGEPEPLSQVMQQERCRQLQTLLDEHLRDDKDRLVYLGSFEWDLKPREICELHREHFEDVQEVYRVKRNLLERLSRDARLAAWMEMR